MTVQLRHALIALCACVLVLALPAVPASAATRQAPTSTSNPDSSDDPDTDVDDPTDDPADDTWPDDDSWPDDDADDPADPGYVDPTQPLIPPVVVPKTRTIAGKIALVRADGKAAIPRGAPKRVQVAIAAANRIVGKPYKWGGGHARLTDRGYDCSGAVGYSLIGASLLGGPMVSGQLAKWGSAGAGRYITVFANKTHVYMEIAGLRLDTSPVGDPAGRSGVRWRPVIGKRRGFHVRHPAGL